MSQKTTGKAPQLRQTAFNFDKPAYRARSQDKRLNELLAIRGVYRGSDARFVTGSGSVNTTKRSRSR